MYSDQPAFVAKYFDEVSGILINSKSKVNILFNANQVGKSLFFEPMAYIF